jgi:hypothetical protein
MASEWVTALHTQNIHSTHTMDGTGQGEQSIYFYICGGERVTRDLVRLCERALYAMHDELRVGGTLALSEAVED